MRGLTVCYRARSAASCWQSQLLVPCQPARQLAACPALFYCAAGNGMRPKDAPCIVLPHQNDYVPHIALDIGTPPGYRCHSCRTQFAVRPCGQERAPLHRWFQRFCLLPTLPHRPQAAPSSSSSTSAWTTTTAMQQRRQRAATARRTRRGEVRRCGWLNAASWLRLLLGKAVGRHVCSLLAWSLT